MNGCIKILLRVSSQRNECDYILGEEFSYRNEIDDMNRDTFGDIMLDGCETVDGNHKSTNWTQ